MGFHKASCPVDLSPSAREALVAAADLVQLRAPPQQAFARAVTEAIKQTVRDTGATRVILCASPRMLGALRGMDLPRDGLVIDELARDHVKFTPPQIHDQLVKHGLLPAPAPHSGLRAP